MTIEERAIADANRVVGESNNFGQWLSHKKAYERVATEQREIDLRIAAVFMCDNCCKVCDFTNLSDDECLEQCPTLIDLCNKIREK